MFALRPKSIYVRAVFYLRRMIGRRRSKCERRTKGTMIATLIKRITSSLRIPKPNMKPNAISNGGGGGALLVSSTQAMATGPSMKNTIYSRINKFAKDLFVPKHDKCMDAVMDAPLLEVDNDIWVERFYRSKKGHTVSFFRSYKTRRCVALEPPSGSSMIVFWNELPKYPCLQEFAREPLDRPHTDFERPDYRGRSLKERKEKESSEDTVISC